LGLPEVEPAPAFFLKLIHNLIHRGAKVGQKILPAQNAYPPLVILVGGSTVYRHKIYFLK
jgi:hypothetical protein